MSICECSGSRQGILSSVLDALGESFAIESFSDDTTGSAARSSDAAGSAETHAYTDFGGYMVRIRLRRIGSRGRPYYRIVVSDQRAAAKGRFIEQIGFYDPIPDPPRVEIDADRARKWLNDGAQPSDPVAHMLKSAGIMAQEGVAKDA